MPRARDEANPNTRRNQLGVMLTDDELAMVKRVAERYGGLSLSMAGRLLMLEGAEKHDPSPPSKGAHK